MCLFTKEKNRINITGSQCWYQWLTIFECKSFIGSHNDCQAHHRSSTQFNWRRMYYWLCMAVLSQCNPLHYIFPTALWQALNYFLSLWSVYRGWEKSHVLVQTADIFIQAKKPDNISSQIQLLHDTHNYYRNLGQILRLNCAGTELMSVKRQIKPS